MGKLIYHTQCNICNATLSTPSILAICEPCFDADDTDDDLSWYAAELWLVDRDGRQHHCWTGQFVGIDALKQDLITHYRNKCVGRPRIHKVNEDGTKTFVEELDMRTPQQIAYSKQEIVL